MKHYLVIGGTGAMGMPLVNILSRTNEVYVTSRSAHLSSERVKYLKGNAKSRDFLKEVLQLRMWDAVVDFMVWGAAFEEVLPLMLSNTNQYIFISSARVYAQSDEPITEETPRLLDVIQDEEYLKTNEYGLAKAREEDLLLNSGRKNYTIIRPSITYNTNRLQLGVLEKESWLYRALNGRSIVFSEDIAQKYTTMTHGEDMASGIASVVGQDEALENTYHITCPKALLWRDVLNIYMNELERHLGHSPKVVMTKTTTSLQFEEKKFQVIYCRYFNRSFNNEKISRFCNVKGFVLPEKGLSDCLASFLLHPKFQDIDWTLEAVNDRVAGEHTPLSVIPSLRSKLGYLTYRYNIWPIKVAERLIDKIRS